jgi:hypothetical protein
VVFFFICRHDLSDSNTGNPQSSSRATYAVRISKKTLDNFLVRDHLFCVRCDLYTCQCNVDTKNKIYKGGFSCSMQHIKCLRTGDILFFDEHPSQCLMCCLTSIIKCCTRSLYSHVAIVVIDPPWTDLKGCYVWESSSHGIKDPQDGKIKFGVQLTPISFYLTEYPGSVNIYIRRPTNTSTYAKWDNVTLQRIQKKVYDKPYDTRVKDWVSAWLKISNRRTSTRFFCSAFVCYILVELGIVDDATNWTLMTAADMATSTGCEWDCQYNLPTTYSGNGGTVGSFGS